MGNITNTVFVAKILEINDNNFDLFVAGRPMGGSLEIHQSEVGVFSSLEKAETEMRIYYRLNSSWLEGSVAGAVITEKSLDYSFNADHSDTPDFESIRLYDSSLSFVIAVNEPAHGMNTFCGIDSPSPHNVGDYVMVRCGNELVPSMVVCTPFTKDEWKRRFAKDAKGDWTDDCYTTVSFGKNFHEHPLVTNVISIPNGIVFSDEVRWELSNLSNEYANGHT